MSVKNVSASNPLFIVGCGRSGTTLVRMMLDGHEELGIPGESHIIYQLARMRAWGLWRPRLDAGGVERFLRLVEGHKYIRRWGLESESLCKRFQELEKPTYAALIATLFNEYAKKEGKIRWGDKTPLHVQYLWILDRMFPGAKFLHVIRDGRDVALSLLTRRWGPRHISHAGLYWKWLVLSGMVTGAILGPDRYLELRFEDLVKEPEANLRLICEWADLEYRDSMLRYDESRAAKEYAAAGDEGSARLRQPPDSSRVFLWKRIMRPGERRGLLRQAGALLELLGYEIEGESPSRAQELLALRKLLAPDTLRQLDGDATARTGGELTRVIGLQAERWRQLANFLSHRFVPWSVAGIRWQRTVADMLF